MRRKKIELVHCVFRLSQTINKKVYMSKRDFKKFYKACDLTLPSGEQVNTADYTLDYVEHDYKKALEVEAIFLEFQSQYGGYSVKKFYKGSGEDYVLPSYGVNADTLCLIIRAFIKGVGYQVYKGEA